MTKLHAPHLPTLLRSFGKAGPILPTRGRWVLGFAAAALAFGVSLSGAQAATAEDFYKGRTVTMIMSADAGGGYDVGWAAETEWLEYTVNVATPGLYRFDTRYAAYGGGVFHLESDGINKSGPITNLNTGGWGSWATLTCSNVALNAGQQVLRLSLDHNGGGGFVGNFNYLTFTLTANNNPPSVILTNPVNGAVFSVSNAITLKASASDTDGSPSKVEFFADDNLIGSVTNGPFSLIWSNVPVGVHVLTARVTDNVGLTGVSAPVSLSVINGQAPFFGVPKTIPGLIQAEDFDSGNNGAAYKDLTVGNQGG